MLSSVYSYLAALCVEALHTKCTLSIYLERILAVTFMICDELGSSCNTGHSFTLFFHSTPSIANSSRVSFSTFLRAAGVPPRHCTPDLLLNVSIPHFSSFDYLFVFSLSSSFRCGSPCQDPMLNSFPEAHPTNTTNISNYKHSQTIHFVTVI